MNAVRRVLVAMLRQRRRLALATVAIALSIGYLAGALTLLGRVGAGLDRLAASGGERADLVVEGGVAYESPLEQVRRLVPSSVGTQLADVPGIASVSPRVEDVAVIVDPDGRPLVTPGLSEQPLGANWPDDDAVAPWRLVAGRPPRAEGEVVVDERSAGLASVGVGDTVGVAGKALVGRFRVVGVVSTQGGALPAGATLALFSTEQARTLFDRPTDDNSVALRLERGADPARVGAEVAARLPAGTEVVDGPTAAQHRQEALSRSFTLVRALVVGFAGLALVVGMATVANSLSLLHAQRRRTFAELRLVGARRRQLVAAALVEAALLALVASLAGAPLGVLLGRVIEGALGALDTAVPVAGSWLSWSALGWAVLVGVLATVAAAVVPALRACAVAPVEAVAEVPPGSGSRRGRCGWRVAAGAFVAAVLAAVVAAVVTARQSAVPAGLPGGGPDPAVAALAAGAAALLVLVLAAAPAVLSVLVSTGVRLLPVRPLPLRRIAARDVDRNRSRTAATTGALVLAVAVVAGLAVFLSSFASSVEGQVDRLVTADLVVDSGTFTRGGLPGDLLERLGSLPGVEAVSGWQVGRANIGTRPVRLTGLDLASLDRVVSPAWTQRPGPLDATTVLLDADVARNAGYAVGDLVPLTFTSGGTENLRLAGTYAPGNLLLGEAVVDRTVVSRQVPATTDIAGLVAGASGRVPTADVRRLAGDYGITRVLAPQEFVEARATVLRGFERVIQWMLLFTLLQALVGVVNTLLLSVGERRRELGLLRAAGASRRQVLRLVLLEGTALAVVGTAAGLALGVVGASAAVAALGSLGLDRLVLPPGTLVLTAVAAVALGVLAAVAPARWAAAVPPLDAVSDVGGIRSRPRPAHRPRWYRWGRPGFHVRSGEDLVEAVPPSTLLPPPYLPPAQPVPGVVVPGLAVPGAPPPLLHTSTAGTGLSPSGAASAPAVPAPVLPPVPPPPGPPVAGPPDLAALGRLGPLVTGALAAGEAVRHVVAGHVRGLPAAVALTDRRLLVVADRPPRAVVTSLHPGGTALSVRRAVAGGPISLYVVDGDRMLELSGVTDVASAWAMCSAER